MDKCLHVHSDAKNGPSATESTGWVLNISQGSAATRLGCGYLRNLLRICCSVQQLKNFGNRTACVEVTGTSVAAIFRFAATNGKVFLRHPALLFSEILVDTKDVHGNGIPIPMGFPRESHGNTNMPKMGMGMGRVHVTMGMGMATFSCVPKFPLVDSMRMLANKIL